MWASTLAVFSSIPTLRLTRASTRTSCVRVLWFIVLYCPMFRYECSCSDWAEYIYLQIAAVFLLIFFTLALPVRCYMLIRANKPKGSREDPGMRYDEDGQLVECVLGSSGKRGVWLTRGGRVHAAGTLITCTTWTS